jgi:NADH dehydrogenase
LGEHEAVAEVLGMHFRGFWAWWMWRTIYLAKLPGALRRLRVTIDWTFDVLFPRDISVVQHPPDEIVRPIHLEKGEILFVEGSPARGVFYVRQGALSLGGPGKPGRDVGSGEVIDCEETDENGIWKCTATASDASDLIVFHGRAFHLMKDELKLVPRKKK